ncbi:hypothetical protein HYU45_01430 [Candidatus Daviesbacteria bacterium]|nr:hypothetical protein [Candidatus Daviesbacteria bacterium]
MSNQSLSQDDTSLLPPPSGGSEKADLYLNQLIELINEDKLIVSHTDLAKFDPTSLQDHYRLDLKDYEVEVSHSKQADTGKDFYVLLFNNLKSINEGCTEKVILAYIHITEDQFAKFKTVAETQIERKRKEAEEKRFKEVMAPIDQALEKLVSSPADIPLEAAPDLQNHRTPSDSTSPFGNTRPAFASS